MRSASWGYPIGLNQAADWRNCPTLSKPNRVKEIKCDGATCMSICQENYIAQGKDFMMKRDYYIS